MNLQCFNWRNKVLPGFYHVLPGITRVLPGRFYPVLPGLVLPGFTRFSFTRVPTLVLTRFRVTVCRQWARFLSEHVRMRVCGVHG